MPGPKSGVCRFTQKALRRIRTIDEEEEPQGEVRSVADRALVSTKSGSKSPIKSGRKSPEIKSAKEAKKKKKKK